MGARRRRDAAGASRERPARTDSRSDGRADQDRARRGDRVPVGRRGVRHGDCAADRYGLHHASQVPPQHLLGRGRHTGPRVTQAVHRRAGARHQLLLLRSRGAATDNGGDGLPHDQRDGWAHGPAGHAAGGGALEGEGTGLFAAAQYAGRAGRRRHILLRAAGSRAGQGAGQQADRALRRRAREQDAHRAFDAHIELEPHGRHDAQLRDRHALQRGGAAGRYDPDQLRRLGRDRASRLSWRRA